MEAIIKKLLMRAAVLSVGLNTYAYDFEVDDIYYNITSSTEKTVEVTNRNNYSNSYSGNVVIPEKVSYNNDTYSVTNIGYNAFNGSHKLTSVTIPNSIISIGDYTFYGCSGLTSVTIPNSVTSIGDYTFYGCTNIKKLVFDDGEKILELGNNLHVGLFRDCPLETVYLGRNLKYDESHYSGYSPFYGTPITTIIISDSVTSIGGYAFYYCSKLTSVTIPNSVTSIGYHAFDGCNGIKSVNISDLSAWCKIDFASSDSNPLCYGHNLYLKGEPLTDLTIPNDITEIKDFAFIGCSGLISLTIPNSVTSIGESAFSYCTGLTSVTIPNSITSIGDYAFSYCTGLTSVTIGNSVTSIGDYAFRGCTGLTSVTIPNSVTSIGDYAFSYCTGLTSVTIGNSVTSIGESAFQDCIKLTSVTIPNSVTSIGDYAFQDCSKLISVTIGNSVTSIGDYAFQHCSSLDNVNISDLSAWCKIDFASSDSNPLCYGHNLYLKGEPLTDLTIPNDITEIKNFAFIGCSGLISVTIPSNVITIGNYAFSGCSALKSFLFGNNVTTIGEEAFSDCTAMTQLWSRAEVPPVCGYQALEDINKWTCKLFVPEESLESYKAAYQWKDFFFFGGIEDTVSENNNLSVATYRDSIDIIGADNAVITVYNLSGQLVYSGTETTVGELARGIYIVRVAGQTFKVAL